MTDNTTTEGSALVWVEMMASQLAMGHLTDGVNEVLMVKIFEPVLVRIMCVGTTVKLVG